jgi:putative flippase GtrA
MKALLQRVLSIRIIRYGMVGGIGIPVNDLSLLLFQSLLGHDIANTFLLYAICSACAFEVSNIVNFTLNQFFTYREQLKDIHGWEWVRRAAKGQLTSLSALLLSYGIGLLLVGVFHVNDYIASPAGIIGAFVYNFFISNKLVFRPVAPKNPTPAPEERAIDEQVTEPQQAVQVTPKG